jgi:hypothetical protein
MLAPPQVKQKHRDAQAYAALVREVRKYHAEFIKHEFKHKMFLGEKAHLLETHYREKTLERFVKDAEIDVAVCTLERWRSVYRAWYVEISAPGPISISYAVARTLQTHPNRLQIVTKNPKLTKREAEALMQALDKHHDEEPEDEPGDEPPKGKGAATRSWSAEDARRWLNQVSEHATQFLQHAGFGDSRWVSPFGDVDTEQVRQAMREKIQPGFLDTLQQAGKACLQLKKKLEEMVA